MIVYALVPSIYSTVRTFYRHRISVRVPDRSLAGKTAYCAVACYDPCAVFVDIQVAVSVPAISGIGFIIHNRSGEGAACHIQIQLADAVPDDIALHFLIVRAKEAVILFVIAHVSGQIRVKQVQRIQALDADRL